MALEEVEWDKVMPMNSEQHTRLNRGRKSTGNSQLTVVVQITAANDLTEFMVELQAS